MTTRTIRTTYFEGTNREPLKICASAHPNRAVTQCIGHMQTNEYGATTAEVYSEATGELYAQVTRRLNGQIVITYKYDPAAIVGVYSAQFLFQKARANA